VRSESLRRLRDQPLIGLRPIADGQGMRAEQPRPLPYAPRVRVTQSLRGLFFRRFALLAGLVTALVGCGGDSALSADELAQRANAICASYQPLYRTITNVETGAAVVRYLGVVS
jgi:hypothetical protein